jgi:CheY-like chemotaxis protein
MNQRHQIDAESGRGEGTRGKGPIAILHVDDDPNDTALLQAASRRAGILHELHNVADGEEAIAYLDGTEPYEDRTRYQMPALILLDLKMPRATGFEILQWIRRNPRISRIPVVVLSGSELEEDIRKAYASGANSYLVKPLGFDALVDLIRSVCAVWLSAGTAKLVA